jgi:hypothetical protein
MKRLDYRLKALELYLEYSKSEYESNPGIITEMLKITTDKVSLHLFVINYFNLYPMTYTSSEISSYYPVGGRLIQVEICQYVKYIGSCSKFVTYLHTHTETHIHTHLYTYNALYSSETLSQFGAAFFHVSSIRSCIPSEVYEGIVELTACASNRFYIICNRGV